MPVNAGRAEVGVLKVIRGNADRSEFNLEAHYLHHRKARGQSDSAEKGWFKPEDRGCDYSRRPQLCGDPPAWKHDDQPPTGVRAPHLSDGDLLEVGGLVLEFNFKG